jgi:cytochrome c oxidase cbb3-type subunit 3
MKIVRQTGRTLFGDNCAACHGFNAKGGRLPDLTTSSWLWGGDPATIAETIRIGINSTHPNTRVGQMLAFGRDNLLSASEVNNVVSYVESLSDPGLSKRFPPATLEAGKATFAASCASCHGDDGKGKLDVGGPDLTDTFWIYGGDTESILASVRSGRQGHMPSWEHRLGAVERKILTIYPSI